MKKVFVGRRIKCTVNRGEVFNLAQYSTNSK